MAIKNYGFGDFFEGAEQTEPLVAPQKPKGTYRQVMDKIASYAPSTEGASYWAEQAFEAPRHVLNTATDALMPAVMAPVAGVAGLGSMFAGPEDLSFDQRINRAKDVTNTVLRFGQSHDPKIEEVVGAAHAVLPNMISGTAKFLRGSQEAYKQGLAEQDARLYGTGNTKLREDPKWVQSVNKTLEGWDKATHEKVNTFLDDTARYWGEVAARNQPKFKGTFMENPSVTRAAAAFVQGGMSVAIAVPLAAAIGPGAAGTILAVGEGGHMYDEAIAAKKTPQEAFRLTTRSVALTALLERYGLENILKASGPAGKRFLRGMIAEAGTEDAQTLVQNAIKKHGYDKSVSYIDGIIESTIGGLAGGPAAVIAGSQGSVDSTVKPSVATTPAPSPKAEDSVADLLSQLGTAIEEDQRNELVDRVTELGSIEAVQKAYPNYKTDVNDAYAVALSIMAEETGLFKKAQVEDVSPETLIKPSFEVVGKLFRGEALTDAEVEELQAMSDEDVQREYFRLKSQDDFITDLRERFKLPDADEMQKRSQETFVAELRKRFKLPDEAATPVQKTVEGPVSTEAVPVGPAENVTVVETEPTQIAEPLAEPAEETETLPETDEEIEDELFDDEDEDDVSFDMNRMGSLLDELDEQENPYGKFIAKGNVDAVPNEAEASDLQAEQDAAKRREELEAQRKAARERQRAQYADEAVDDEATEELTGNLYDEGLHTTEALKEVDSENPAYDTAEQVDTLLKKGAKGVKKLIDDLTGDERGAVGPDLSDLKRSLREVSQDIQIAKRKAARVSKKASQEIEKVSKRVKAAVEADSEALPEKLPPLLEDLNKIAQKVQQTIVAEEVLKQEKELNKKLLKGLRLKKDTLLKMAGTITRQMEIDIDRPFYDDGDSPIHQFYRLMREAGRIVPTYRKGTFTVQPHPRPLLDPSKPKLLDPSKDLGGVVKWVGDKLNVETVSGQILSPSVVLRSHFAPGQHPIVDALECAICAGEGRRNDFRWKKDVFGDVKSAKKDIEKTLGPLYEKIQIRLEETGRMKRRFVRKLDELKAAKRAVRLNTSRLQSVESTHPRISDFVSDLAKAQEDIEIFTAQKNKLKKQIRAYAKDSKKMLFEGYDAVITELAERNASVRIALDAADSLPSKINMSETERWRAKQLRKYFEQTRQDLRLRGFPVIESRAYMSHSFGSLMTDDWAKAFKYEPYVPKRFKFLYQSPKSRIWIPDVHMILDNYIPMVNRKLGLQPFLDRWSDFIDHEAPPNMRAMLQQWLRLNMYNDYGGFWNKVTNSFVGLEYLRLIGFSVATATKHAAKYIDTFATNTAGVSMHGTFLAGKSIFQGIADKLGMKGEHPEYEVFKMFVSANQIIRVLDEGPQLQASWKLVKGLAGSLTMFTEMVDNGTTVMASLLQASGAKMDMLQAKNLVWDAICRANFRGGMDQPLYMKTPGGRIIGMFQTTVQKLTELRVGLLKDFVKGGTDAYGKSNRMKFVRYVMLFGALTMFARRHDKDIAHWFIELPYIRHWFQQSNQTASGVRLMEPKLTGPPPLELVNQMATKGVYHGIKDHIDYTPLWKYITIWNKPYPNSYYTDPVSQMFGLHSLDAGHSKGGSSRRSRRRPRRSRRS